jgi:hypothetical protein
MRADRPAWRNARDVLTLCAIRLGAAENHIFDLGGSHLGSFAQYVSNTMGGKVFGAVSG